MDWKDVGTQFAKLGLPLLGAAIAGPGGASIGSALASHIGEPTGQPESMLAALTSDANAIQKAREFELTHQETMLKTLVQAGTEQVASINTTLQADARGDSFWQKNHHAFESSFVVVMIAALYVGLPLVGIPVPAVPESVFIMLGAILGVTAWQHGQVNQHIAAGGDK